MSLMSHKEKRVQLKYPYSGHLGNPSQLPMVFHQIRRAWSTQVLSFSMSKKNISPASIVIIFVFKTRRKQACGRTGYELKMMLLNGRNHSAALEWKRWNSGKKTTKCYAYPLTGKEATETNCSPFSLRMSKITDFIFSKEFLGLLLDKLPFCKDERALEQRCHSWGWRVLTVPNVRYTRTYRDRLSSGPFPEQADGWGTLPNI